MDLNQLIDLVTKGGGPGIAIVFAALYWMERQERRDGDKERLSMMERMLTAMHETASTLSSFREIIGRGPGQHDNDRR